MSVVEGAVLLVVMLVLVGIVEAVVEDKVLVVVVLIVGGTVVGAVVVVVAVVAVVGLVIVVGEVVVVVVGLIGRLSNTETVPEPAFNCTYIRSTISIKVVYYYSPRAVTSNIVPLSEMFHSSFLKVRLLNFHLN